MRIQALDRDWDINDITYKERREIYHLNVKAFWDGKVDPDLYYEVLEKCAEVSGLKEEDFKDLSMMQIDQLLQAILSSYLGLEKKVSGD
jgi:hypothetical protein